MPPSRAALALDLKPEVLWRISRKLGFSLICMGVAFTLLYVLRVIASGIEGPPIFGGARQELNDAVLLLHILTAIVPLTLGPFAFSARLRARKLVVHRSIGKAYVLAIWISSIIGLVLALANTRGYAAKAGFSTLAVLWFSTTYLAYWSVRRRDLVRHRRWMIRSYGLTLAVVSVRPMFLFPPDSIPPEYWYPIVTWACWVPNLLLAELYVYATKHSGALRTFGRWRADEHPESRRSAPSALPSQSPTSPRFVGLRGLGFRRSL